MTTISIFGTGSMGIAIGNLFTASGTIVQYVGRHGTERINGEIVVLAVPWEAISDIVERYRDQFSDRIVIDVTNPLDFETFAELRVPAGSSAAAELQVSLPSARVLKAFNTAFATTLGAKQIGPNPVTVLVAGDDIDAKRAVIELITAGGVDAIDAGVMARAHELEAIGFLQLTLANDNKIGWSGGFGVVR